MIQPRLNASISYNHYFIKQASIYSNKQQYISGGTNKYALGIEYQVNKTFLISAGGQITNHNVTKEYQTELDFILDSYTLGLGGIIKASNNIQVNIGYSFTRYSKKKYSFESYSNSYNQTKNSVGIGISYSF